LADEHLLSIRRELQVFGRLHPTNWAGPNRSSHQRRLYINGYVRADACDRGEWAFRGGRPVSFGPEQALVHYEQLRSRPDPHYV
jgi:hypothetical protein